MKDLEAALRPLVAALVREELQRQRTDSAGEYLSTKEAAAVASVAEKTIRRWIAAGVLTEHRAGREIRVLRSELEQVLRTPRHSRRERAKELSPEELAERAFR